MEDNQLAVVIGASGNPSRYSYKAVLSLRKHNIPVIAIGRREGTIGDVKILTGKPSITDPVDTVTLYLSEENQQDMIDYILALKPRRIIFNPGAENPFLEELAARKGILVLDACTLVMLSTEQY